VAERENTGWERQRLRKERERENETSWQLLTGCRCRATGCMHHDGGDDDDDTDGQTRNATDFRPMRRDATRRDSTRSDHHYE
jgi:hypothetical protein